MRHLAVVLPVGGLAAILASPAFGAPPLPVQIAVAAGRSDLTVLNTAKMSLPETGREAYSIKAVTADGKLQQLTVDGAGNPADGSALLAAEALARQQHYGNLKPRLFEDLQTRSSDELVPVHIWAKVNITYPRKEDLLGSSVQSQAFTTQVNQKLSAAVEPIIAWLSQQKSVTLAQHGSSDIRSPLVSASVPASAVQDLSRLSNVAWVDLETPPVPASTVWYQTTDVPSARALTVGQGVTGCAVDIDIPNPAAPNYARVGGINVSSGTFGLHMEEVASIMSNTYSLNTTSITDSPIYMSYTANRSPDGSAELTGAFTWCTDQGAAVINYSMEAPGRQTLSGSELMIDWLVKNSPWPFVAAAAGNMSETDSNIYCGNRGYNVLVVGGSDDNETTALGDDRMYAWSRWHNPATDNQDYEIPHLVAPALNIDSANATGLNGTSFATPQVSGTAMLVMSRNPSLKSWPEPTKAILMATATANIDADSFSYLGHGVGVGVADMQDGVGLLDTGKAVALADPGNRVDCNNEPRAKGYYFSTVDLLSQPETLDCKWRLKADADGAMRVIASWDGTTTCSQDGSNCTSDLPDADLDVWVYDNDSSGNLRNLICYSSSYDSSWEGCQFPVKAESTYTVQVKKWSNNQPNTYFGLAWNDIPKPPRPTQQASLGFVNGFESPPGNLQMTLGWRNGDGEGRVAVFMAANPGPGVPTPVDGIVYYESDGEPWMQGWQDSNFGAGTQVGTSGWYCVYNGPGSGLGGVATVFGGLQLGTTYGVMAVAYNGSNPGATTYLTDSAIGNPVLWLPGNTTIPMPTRAVPAASPPAVLALGILLCAAGLRRISRTRGAR